LQAGDPRSQSSFRLASLKARVLNGGSANGERAVLILHGYSLSGAP
jgi:hypothetical protein